MNGLMMKRNERSEPVTETLLARNRDWAERMRREDPDYFRRHSAPQHPAYFWIGCCDSRVPANVVAGLAPGEIFVHRNIANIVHASDLNLLSALEYAVDALKIRKIVLCGHDSCGGVRAASEDAPHGLCDHWLEPIRRLAHRETEELATIPREDRRLDRLAELNVMDGVRRLAETPILRRAWDRGDPVEVHGMMYGLQDGRLRALGVSLDGRNVAEV